MERVMPIHDWARVDAGIVHDFRIAWIGSLCTKLNAGLLPSDYFALVERNANNSGPDTMTLREPLPRESATEANDTGGEMVIAEMAPKVFSTAESAASFYRARQRKLVIRHTSGNRIVAILEILSEANKKSRHAFDTFLEKALSALEKGIHLLLVDLQPPSSRDPQGIHSALWEELAGEGYQPPPGKNRTLVAYSAGQITRAYIEPVAIGQDLTPMPLFLTEDRYVNVPLEETYQAAYEGVPRLYKRVLEAKIP